MTSKNLFFFFNIKEVIRDKVSEKFGGEAIRLHTKTCIVILYFTPEGRKRTYCSLLR
jgi:hypothetical protein